MSLRRTSGARTRGFILSMILVAAISATWAGTGTPIGAGVPGPTTSRVYVATGQGYADALGAAPAAASDLAPILLVDHDLIPEATLAELHRLTPPTIVIVGGTAVIGTSVESDLRDLPWSPEITRLWGADRYSTAAKISGSAFPTTGLFPRVAHEYVYDPPGTGTSRLVTTEITAPAAGTLWIDAWAQFSADDATLPDSIFCWLTFGDIYGGLGPPAIEDDFGYYFSCHVGAAVDVEAGYHFIALWVQKGDAHTESAAIRVMWLPFDGAGAVPTP